jgi:hypothetical protein
MELGLVHMNACQAILGQLAQVQEKLAAVQKLVERGMRWKFRLGSSNGKRNIPIIGRKNGGINKRRGVVSRE